MHVNSERDSVIAKAISRVLVKLDVSLEKGDVLSAFKNHQSKTWTIQFNVRKEEHYKMHKKLFNVELDLYADSYDMDNYNYLFNRETGSLAVFGVEGGSTKA